MQPVNGQYPAGTFLLKELREDVTPQAWPNTPDQIAERQVLAATSGAAPFETGEGRLQPGPEAPAR